MGAVTQWVGLTALFGFFLAGIMAGQTHALSERTRHVISEMVHYIFVPLYFAAERPVVERDGALIMVDDDRMRFEPGEEPQMRTVRFRTLGCYPLTGAVESDADTLPLIIQEMLLARNSEREGRVIDYDEAGSMEDKKREGYF